MTKRVIDQYFSQLFFGLDINTTPAETAAWGAAQALIVAADGVSPKERELWVNVGRHMGTPAEVIEAALAIDPSKVDAKAMLKPFHGTSHARAMLYLAITIARADGYSDPERAAAARAAKSLGVDQGTLHAIEALAESEAALNRTKGALLAG